MGQVRNDGSGKAFLISEQGAGPWVSRTQKHKQNPAI
jgi:hypothetical protein